MDGDQLDVIGLARVLAARGHEVRVYERRNAPETPANTDVAPGVRLVSIEAGPSKPLSDEEFRPYVSDFGLGLSDEWRRWRPDVVHSHALRAGLAATASRDQIGIPIVQTPHLPRTMDQDWARLELALCRDADAVIVHTHADLSTVLRSGVPRAKITVIPLTVDVDRFHPMGPGFARTWRRRLVTVGPLRPAQGFANVIETLRQLPEAELIVAGTPSTNGTTAAEAERLRSVAERSGVDGRVKVFDALPVERRPDLLRSADIVVSVPEREWFGLGVLEAMACGRTVIASATGGHLDTVVHRSTGVLVPPGDAKTLAPAIRMLLGDPIRLDGYGMAGRERAEKRYTWDKAAEAYEASYHAVRG